MLKRVVSTEHEILICIVRDRSPMCLPLWTGALATFRDREGEKDKTSLLSLSLSTLLV